MILIYTTDKNHPRKVIETCQVNFLLCNDLLRHFNMLLQGSALALASHVPGRSALFHTPAGDGEGAARAWLPAALQDFACHCYLPFLPSYSPFREKRGKPDTGPLSQASLPGRPQISTISTLHVSRGTLSQSLSCWLSGCTSWSFAVLLAQSPFSPFFKTTLPGTPISHQSPPAAPNLRATQRDASPSGLRCHERSLAEATQAPSAAERLTRPPSPEEDNLSSCCTGETG